MSNELAHYGVKGMKWGVRKNSKRTPYQKLVRTIYKETPARTRDQLSPREKRKADRIAKQNLGEAMIRAEKKVQQSNFVKALSTKYKDADLSNQNTPDAIKYRYEYQSEVYRVLYSEINDVIRTKTRGRINVKDIQR